MRQGRDDSDSHNVGLVEGHETQLAYKAGDNKAAPLGRLAELCAIGGVASPYPNSRVSRQ